MHKFAEPLTVQVQNGIPCLWAEVIVNEMHTLEPRYFATVGTGHPITFGQDKYDTYIPQYIGTYQLERLGLVFHVYEISAVDAN